MTQHFTSIPRYLPKRNKNIFHKKTCTKTFTAAFIIIAPNWKQAKYPPTEEWINCYIFVQWNMNYSKEDGEEGEGGEVEEEEKKQQPKCISNTLKKKESKILY